MLTDVAHHTERIHDAETFLDLLTFQVHQRLLCAWLDRRGDGGVPALGALGPVWAEIGRNYHYAWALDAAGEDLLGRDCAPCFRDYMKRGMRGVRFSDHAPGPLGQRMLETHLECLREGTPFAVLRRSHPFPERESGYEAVIVPVQADQGREGSDSLLGHLVPFAPSTVADVLTRLGLRPDIGRKLVLGGAGAC